MNTALIERIKKMPPERRREIEDFVMFLAYRDASAPRRCRRLRQNWAGGLREFRDRFTSAELQKATLGWRNG
jgi:hypothetical protein